MTAAVDPALAAALRGFGADDGQPLHVGGIPAATLLARFGSPLYVFDAAILRARLQAVQQAFGPAVQVLWSVKANPSLAVTRTLRLAGAGAEIASLGELHVALAAGHDAAALRFAGPGKTDGELAAALAAGVGAFHVESLDEVQALAAAARARGCTANVAVRVNFPIGLRGVRLRMAGTSSRFGIDDAQVPAALRAITAEPSLRLLGVHAYAGTQWFDAPAFVEHSARVVAAVARWERDLGMALPEIDLGGGFGVAAFLGDPVFDLAAAGAGVQRLLATLPGPRRWFVELGRFLAAPAGVYLATVVRAKDSGGEHHAVLDGGLHHHAAAAGLGSVLRRTPLLVAAAAPWRIGEPVTIGGPLCTPADQFAEQALVGPLRTGDAIALLHAGAYGLSYSPHSFLSHPTPAEVLVDAGNARVVRERGAASDVLRGQHP
jgi:diaminopimelate decarboxylase